MGASDLLQKVVIRAREAKQSIAQGVGTASEFVRKNPVTSGVTVGGGLLAGATIIQIAKKRKKAKVKKKTARRKAPKKPTQRRKTKSRTKVKGKKWYGKTRSKKIFKTKTGQPYVILASGKARFIKKSRASAMRKRKGGYK